MTDAPTTPDAPRQLLVRTLAELRPRLHRYCARMTGSAVDGEDVVQEAILKALESPPPTDNFSMLERWLIRVAHNAAIDHLRRRKRFDERHTPEDLDMIIDRSASADTSHVAMVGLRTFMHLPVLQRSAVIFKDVLGYSLNEVAEFTSSSIPAVKSALQRGRARLEELSRAPDDTELPALDEHEHRLLATYAERFNARDFEAVRDMLAEEVRLDLVNRVQATGTSKVANYFGNYQRLGGWRLAPGMVDRKPALLAFDPDDVEGTPMYFLVLEWHREKIVAIRDFRYARYAMEGAEILVPGKA